MTADPEGREWDDRILNKHATTFDLTVLNQKIVKYSTADLDESTTMHLSVTENLVLNSTMQHTVRKLTDRSVCSATNLPYL